MEYMHGAVMREGDTMVGDLSIGNLDLIVDAGSGVVQAKASKYLELGSFGVTQLFLGANGSETAVRINSEFVLFPVRAATVGAPTAVSGGMFFDSTKDKMQVCNDGTNWVNMDGS